MAVHWQDEPQHGRDPRGVDLSLDLVFLLQALTHTLQDVVTQGRLVDLKGVAVNGPQEGVKLLGAPHHIGSHILVVHLGQVLGLSQNHVHLNFIGALVAGAAAVRSP